MESSAGSVLSQEYEGDDYYEEEDGDVEEVYENGSWYESDPDQAGPSSHWAHLPQGSFMSPAHVDPRDPGVGSLVEPAVVVSVAADPTVAPVRQTDDLPVSGSSETTQTSAGFSSAGSLGAS